jgi:hypothetical protein
MNYSLAYTLGKYRAGRTDPDASAYIAAVTTAGATVTSAQRTFIDNFYKAAKLDYYTSLKRLYLPIWGVAAANAIDMITRTSGTFVGGVTHASGYVQSNGTTGYFNLGVSASTLGLTAGTGWMGALMKTAVTNHQYLAAIQSGSQMCIIRHSLTTFVSEFCNSGTGRISSTSAADGIMSFCRSSGTSANQRRISSGRSVLTSQVQADQGSITTINHFALGRNNNGTADSFSTSEMGAYWIGTGVSDTQDSNMTLHLKNLWEGCTGLTLP